MEKRDFGKTGYKVSPVVFGGIITSKETQEDANSYVEYAIEHGVNYFDVAPTYSNAQTRLGIALEPFRKDVYLACKTMQRSAEKSKAELLESMELLKTDHFDVYQLHQMTTEEDFEETFGKGGVMETVLWAKKEGIIRKIGISAHSEDIALKCLDTYDFDSVLFPMNWALGLNKGWGDRISEKVKQKGCGLLGMKTLIHRKWREGEEKVYPKSWCKPIFDNDELAVAAMKYGFHKGCDTLIPPGNFEHFKLMTKYADEIVKPLTDAEMAMLKAEAILVKDEGIF